MAKCLQHFLLLIAWNSAWKQAVFHALVQKKMLCLLSYVKFVKKIRAANFQRFRHRAVLETFDEIRFMSSVNKYSKQTLPIIYLSVGLFAECSVLWTRQDQRRKLWHPQSRKECEPREHRVKPCLTMFLLCLTIYMILRPTNLKFSKILQRQQHILIPF